MKKIILPAAIVITVLLYIVIRPPTSTPSVVNVPTPSPIQNIVSKDGTYQADGSYVSPGGPENIGVKLTITDGLISDVSVEVRATNPTSKRMQTAFAGGIKQQVVGKKITELNITKVAGSSLTSGGFNQAIQKIESQM